jgi:opacity protein-like surface antigen
MTKKLLFAVTLMLVASFALMAADVTGKWVAEQPGRNGGPPRQTVFQLKADGAKLTGTMLGGGGGRGGGGAAPAAIEITDGKVDGDKVSFTVKRDTPNGAMETKYNGTVSGDELKLKFEGRGGEMEMVAKRSTT